MKNLILCMSLLLTGVLSAQVKENDETKGLFNKSKFERANEQFNNLSYLHAVTLFNELASDNYRMNDVAPKLGDCYYHLSNTEMAEKWYAKAVAFDSIAPEYYYKYAQMLRSNGKYPESEKWLDRYHKFKSQDSRVEDVLSKKDLLEHLSKQKSMYTVTEMKNLNSEYAEFGAIPWNGNILFISGRPHNLIVGTYYAWNEKPFLDLYVYDTSQVKHSIYLFDNKVNTKYHEGPACFTKDNTILYFTRNSYYKGKRSDDKNGTNHLMLFKAGLQNGKWGNITSLPFNDKDYSVGHPSVSPDGKKLYFAADMQGTLGGTDIFYVDIISETEYGKPVNLGKNINTEGNEMFPFMGNDGLYFSSDGQAGLGGLDIFFSKLLPDGTFGEATNLGAPVNTSKDDFNYVAKSDGRSGLFASNRPGGTGDDDIYAFTLGQLMLNGIVRDSSNQNLPIEKAEVSLNSASGEMITKTETDKNGSFSFNVAFDTKYKLSVIKLGYDQNQKLVSTEGAKESAVNTFVNLGIIKPVVLLGVITDKKTGEKLKDVEIMIVDTVKRTVVLDMKTGEDGLLRKELENVKIKDHIAYKVVLRKEGYLAKTVVFDHYVSSYEINTNQFLDVTLNKIAVGVDIGKLLNINPIYFDLGKWDIRPDAANELNKIVAAMKENPGIVIELGSHTDSRGSSQANMELSDKRAKASATYIVSQGIDESRINGKGFGETRLINKCKDGVKCSEAEHAQNRRTEFKVVKF
jgi:outer membrane protein OmpA-like peptidoglycan-associated protein/tetratricopeptide (TPR) repeat protein